MGVNWWGTRPQAYFPHTFILPDLESPMLHLFAGPNFWEVFEAPANNPALFRLAQLTKTTLCKAW